MRDLPWSAAGTALLAAALAWASCRSGSAPRAREQRAHSASSAGPARSRLAEGSARGRAPLSPVAAKQALERVARCLHLGVSLLQREPRGGALGTFFAEADRQAAAGAPARPRSRAPGVPETSLRAAAAWPKACGGIARSPGGLQVLLPDGAAVSFARAPGRRDELAGGITRWFFEYSLRAQGHAVTARTVIEHQVGGH